MGQESSLTDVALVFLVCMALLTWALPRRFALAPLLITTCYMPLGQMLIVGGLHFQLFRILLLVGVCRVLTRQEAKGLTATRLDKLFLYWITVTLVMGVIQNQFTTRSGIVYDALGSYFLFRCWIRNLNELAGAARFLAWMIVPLAVSMAVEKFTNRNIFSVFGGVPEMTIEREGALRCQGAFRHPILAGTYCATILPLFVGLWYWSQNSKLPGAVGVCCATWGTLASRSSGPFIAMLTVAVGFALWRMRDRMRSFRWAIIWVLIAFSIVMAAPVWYLIDRISNIVGGSGWHRSYLIDQAYHHFNEWWFIGSTYTAHWAPGGQVLAVDPNNMDITNHYIAEGLAGGVLKLGLFIAMIVRGYKTVGRWANRRDVPFAQRMLVWSLGVCLGSHCMSFFSVSYFDQIVVMWYWLLALLAMLASPQLWQSPVQRDSGRTVAEAKAERVGGEVLVKTAAAH